MQDRRVPLGGSRKSYHSSLRVQAGGRHFVRDVVAVHDVDPRILGRGMPLEVGADQPAVPRPVVLRVAGRVHADVPATAADVSLERRLLGIVQHIPCRVQEDDDAVPSQRRVRERIGVFGGIDLESVRRAELGDRLDAAGDRAVPEALRPREHQHSRALRRVAHRTRLRVARCRGRRAGGLRRQLGTGGKERGTEQRRASREPGERNRHVMRRRVVGEREPTSGIRANAGN